MIATHSYKSIKRMGRATRTAAKYNHWQHRLSAVKARGLAGDGSSDATDEPLFGKRELGLIYSQPNGDTSEPVQFPMTIPLLPFDVEEVFLPGSVKTLHLYEARYLALLEDVLARSVGKNKFLGHVVVEQLGNPIGSRASAFPYAYVGENFVMLMGTLCRVLEVKQSKVGALVRIQAEGRMAVKQIVKVAPYIRGTVVPVPDEPVLDTQLLGQQVEALKSTMQDLQNLTMKFKSKQTQELQHSMLWWDKAALIPAAAAAAAADESNSSSISSSITSCSSILEVQAEAAASSSSSNSKEDVDLAERAARLSFAALQRVPEASDMEQLKLLRCCVNALETSDTSQRLKLVHEHMQESQKLLAAKCALKSLKLS